MGTLHPAGWPRPIVDGWPIPWVSPDDALGQTDPERRDRAVEKLLCQVCGTELEDAIVVFVGAPLKPKDESGEIPDVYVVPMDDGLLHPRCARLAAGRCPKLSSMKAAGDLFAFVGPRAAVVLGDLEEDPDGFAAALDGAQVDVFEV